MPEYQLDKIDIVHFKKLAKHNNIYYTIHLDENFNFCDFNPYVSNAYLKTVTETIRIAKKLNVPVLNMHAPWEIVSKSDVYEAKQGYVAFLKEL